MPQTTIEAAWPLVWSDAISPLATALNEQLLIGAAARPAAPSPARIEKYTPNTMLFGVELECETNIRPAGSYHTDHEMQGTDGEWQDGQDGSIMRTDHEYTAEYVSVPFLAGRWPSLLMTLATALNDEDYDGPLETISINKSCGAHIHFSHPSDKFVKYFKSGGPLPAVWADHLKTTMRAKVETALGPDFAKAWMKHYNRRFNRRLSDFTPSNDPNKYGYHRHSHLAAGSSRCNFAPEWRAMTFYPATTWKEIETLGRLAIETLQQHVIQLLTDPSPYITIAKFEGQKLPDLEHYKNSLRKAHGRDIIPNDIKLPREKNIHPRLFEDKTTDIYFSEGENEIKWLTRNISPSRPQSRGYEETIVSDRVERSESYTLTPNQSFETGRPDGRSARLVQDIAEHAHFQFDRHFSMCNPDGFTAAPLVGYPAEELARYRLPPGRTPPRSSRPRPARRPSAPTVYENRGDWLDREGDDGPTEDV